MPLGVLCDFLNKLLQLSRLVFCTELCFVLKLLQSILLMCLETEILYLFYFGTQLNQVYNTLTI